MSVSLTTILFDQGGISSTSQLRDISSRPPSTMFGSLKKKLSRRDSNPLTSSKSTASTRSRSGHLPAPQSSNPFTTGAPPTRRPDRPGMSAFSTPPAEPPPAYTPGPAAQSTPIATASSSTGEDGYAFLKTFDTIFLIDDSGSMAGRSWREVGKALETITPICTERDADGIDVYFLNHPDSSIYKNITSAGTVIEIFQTVRPRGVTPTGKRLDDILRPYMEKYTKRPTTTKPINIIVITDGEPSDDVESPIIWAAKKLDKLDAPAWQVGIQFFQVGREPGAREHLKQLDDDLAHIAHDDDLRDMVDTVPFSGAEDEVLTAAGIMKVLLGSVNRRYDRKSVDLFRKK